MKHVFILAAFFFGTNIGRLAAQELGNKEKMKIFAGWEGHWQGEGSIQMGPGEPKKSKVDEHILYKLDGMVLLVEGLGKSVENPGTIVHQALGILSYDKDDQYTFNTFLRDGKSAAAWLKPIGENKFQWGFDIPNRGKIRYTITIDPNKKTWFETGDFSQDGNNWMKFFEMNLIKVD